MSRSSFLRFALATVAIAGFSAIPAMAQNDQSQDTQSQDAQSVADAARRARENKKKVEAKPGKVFTDDDVKPAATSTAAPAGAASPASAAQGQPGAPGAGPEDEQKAKEIAALKEKIKQVQSDLDLLKRAQSLQQDTYYSNPDYVRDTAGKAKLDDIKQQVADKQGELDSLKDKLAELGGTMDNPAAAPGAPAAGSAPPATPPQN